MLLAAGHSFILSKLCPLFRGPEALECLVSYRPLAGQRRVATREDSQGFAHKSAEVAASESAVSRRGALLLPLVGIPVWSRFGRCQSGIANLSVSGISNSAKL